jgi:hypothetical protein
MGVICISGMFNQQGHQSYEGIKSVKAFGSDDGWCGICLGQGSIAMVDAHLRAQLEKACNEIVGFQNTVNIHLLDKDAEGFGRITRVGWIVVHIHPFAQEVFRFLHQARRILEFTCLQQ